MGLRRLVIPWAFVVSALLTLASGCGGIRSAGGSLADGALARLEADSTLYVWGRELTDSMGSVMGMVLEEEFERAVLFPARTTWSQIKNRARQDINSMTADLDTWVREDLNDAVGRALSDNSNILTQQLPEVAETTADALVGTLAREMVEALAPVGDTLVLGLLRAVAVGMDEELRPALHALMRDVRDSLEVRIQDVDAAVVGSKSLSGLRAVLVGVGLAAVLVVLVVVFGQRRRQSLALHALIDAIDAAEHEGVRAKVRTFAKEAGVHGWLSDRVADRRTCRPTSPSDEGIDETIPTRVTEGA